MTVQVLGNKPSPAVANYSLKHRNKFDKDVKQFIYKDFYVDD